MDVRIRGEAGKLELHDVSRYRAAARHARRLFPGPLGELVSRELAAYADFGHRFTQDGLIARLAEDVLTTPVALHPAPVTDPPEPERWVWVDGPGVASGWWIRRPPPPH